MPGNAVCRENVNDGRILLNSSDVDDNGMFCIIWFNETITPIHILRLGLSSIHFLKYATTSKKMVNLFL